MSAKDPPPKLYSKSPRSKVRSPAFHSHPKTSSRFHQQRFRSMIIFLAFQTCIQMITGRFQVSNPRRNKMFQGRRGSKECAVYSKAFSRSVPQMFPESQGLCTVCFQQVITRERGAFCVPAGRLIISLHSSQAELLWGLWVGHLFCRQKEEHTFQTQQRFSHSKYCFSIQISETPSGSSVLLVPQFCRIYASIFISPFPGAHWVQPEGTYRISVFHFCCLRQLLPM